MHYIYLGSFECALHQLHKLVRAWVEDSMEEVIMNTIWIKVGVMFRELLLIKNVL